ncbi:hypothetical protein ACVCL0_03470 [Rhodanobacter sp. UC4450_H17]
MTPDTNPSPACRNYGKAVGAFIAACANQDARSPIEQWRWLHRCVARLHAVAVEFSLVESRNLDWPSCMRRWPDMDDALRAYRLDVEAAIQSLSGVEPRRRIEGEVRMPAPMPAYSESIPVLLNEMRCDLVDIHASLLMGYAWWLQGHADHQARACECWCRSFETHWGVHALSFLRTAHTLSSLSGSSWR